MFLLENPMYSSFGFIDPEGEIIYGSSYQDHKDILPSDEIINPHLAVMDGYVRWGITLLDKYATFEFVTYNNKTVHNWP